jgi:ABC-type sugar transport system ATPase subunit
MANVEFKNLIKRYGAVEVLHGINLKIDDGEFIVLVGPSGCGKSTTLRMLAGLEEVSGGTIEIDGMVVNEKEPRDRDIAMVFQDYALYPHMSVYDNMAFSLLYRKVSKSDIRRRVQEAAEILGLTEFLDRRPKELSGGQRQRVAMGRAIVRSPQVFLFDEPLSNLDAKLRGTMRLEIKKLHKALGITTVHVTHDQIEAMTLADRVVIMSNGYIEQIGTPNEVYNNPNSLFVAAFIGSPTMNLISGVLDGAGQLDIAGTKIATTDRAFPKGISGQVVLGIRPESVQIVTGGPDMGDTIPVTVDVVEAQGADTLVFGKTGDQDITIRTDSDCTVKADETLHARLDLEKAHLFDPDKGERIKW